MALDALALDPLCHEQGRTIFPALEGGAAEPRFRRQGGGLERPDPGHQEVDWQPDQEGGEPGRQLDTHLFTYETEGGGHEGRLGRYQGVHSTVVGGEGKGPEPE